MPGRKYWFKKWDRFGRYTIINETPVKSKRECQCDCWTIKWVNWSMLFYWRIVSCWCYQLESLSKRPHWLKNWIRQKWLRFPNIYRKMKWRCEDTRYEAYPLYWWRWIKCEWNTLEDFYNDMYSDYVAHCEKYWEKNTTLDRIDVNWNYSKENCRWATRKEQQYNKRNNVTVEIDWEVLWVFEFANRYNISEDTARDRIIRYNKGERSFESLTHIGSQRNFWLEIDGKYYSYNELCEITWFDKNGLHKRLMKYRDWELKAEDLLLTKEEVKNPLNRKRVIELNWKIYDSNTLSEELWISWQSALRRIKLYKSWKMPEEIVLYKWNLTKWWENLINKNDNQCPEKQQQQSG